LVPGLPERYIVVRKIASGGMSEVYLCRLRGEEGFEKKVAVKVIPPRLTEIARFRDLFVREARIAASLSHQNLVQVFDFGRRGNSYFLAMEFVDGWNLAQAVAQLRVRSIPIPLPLWRYWMEGMLDGIAYLHSRNIVHRDISPSNFLLSRGGAVKITDFGIARGSRPGEARKEGWEGKFSYMSPEQARGEDGDDSSDLFSAGIIAAEFFLPGRLFDGEGKEEILSRLRDHDENNLPFGLFPSHISGILKKSLSKDRTDRYPDASSFARAIRTAVPETVSRTDHVAFCPFSRKRAGRRRHGCRRRPLCDRQCGHDPREEGNLRRDGKTRGPDRASVGAGGGYRGRGTAMEGNRPGREGYFPRQGDGGIPCGLCGSLSRGRFPGSRSGCHSCRCARDAFAGRREAGSVYAGSANGCSGNGKGKS
jgi:serine/threonine protein kinase